MNRSIKGNLELALWLLLGIATISCGDDEPSASQTPVDAGGPAADAASGAGDATTVGPDGGNGSNGGGRDGGPGPDGSNGGDAGGEVVESGSRRFRGASDFWLGGVGPSDLVVLDIDGDGLGDLLTAFFLSGEIVLRRGLPDYQFAPPEVVISDLIEARILTGDIDGNGTTDLALHYTSGSQRGVAFLSGRADGTFEEVADRVRFPFTFDVFLSDVSGDGQLDLMYNEQDSKRLVFLEGNGDFTFEDEPVPLFTYSDFVGFVADPVGDFNGDGVIDLVISSPPQVIIGTRSEEGDWSAEREIVVPGRSVRAFVDVNGDGKSDLITILDQSLSIVGSGPNGDLATLYDFPGRPGVNPIIDFSSGSAGNSARLAWLNDVTRGVDIFESSDGGEFEKSQSFSIGNNPVERFLSIDLDGDDLDDLLMLRNGYVSLLRNVDGQLQAPVPPFAEPNAFLGEIAARIGDLDGDGIEDLLLANQRIIFHKGVGDARFDPNGRAILPEDFRFSASRFLVEIEDVDDDGDLDIIVAGGLDSPEYSLFIAENEGGGAYTLAWEAELVTRGEDGNAIDLTPTDVEVADFNGDGADDLAVALSSSSAFGTPVYLLSIAFGDGNGGFGELVESTPPGDVAVATFFATDIDADDRDECVFIRLARADEEPPQTLYVLDWPDDDRGWSVGSTTNVGSTALIGVDDATGDGIDDAVVLRTGEETASQTSFAVFPGVGDGTFGAEITSTPYDTVLYPYLGVTPLGLTDVDGDGLQDAILVLRMSSATVTVAFGRGDGTFSEVSDFYLFEFSFRSLVADVNGDGLKDLFGLGQGSLLQVPPAP